MSTEKELTRELTLEEKEMTKRQKLISGWDQAIMKNAVVFIAGVGALGCEIAKDLALCGVGKLILCDLDTIETSNLSRQMLFYKGDEGQPKAKVAAERLKNMNPYMETEWYFKPIQELPMKLYKSCDVIIAALDNIQARMDLNKFAVNLGIPMIEGGTVGMEGHIQVIVPQNAKDTNGDPIEYGNIDQVVEGLLWEKMWGLDEEKYADYLAAKEEIEKLEEQIEKIREERIDPVDEKLKQEIRAEVEQKPEEYLNHTPCYRCVVPVPPLAGGGVAACTLKGIPRTREQCVFRGQVLFEKEKDRVADIDSLEDMKEVYEYANKELLALRERVLNENTVEGETTPEEIDKIKANLQKTFSDLEVSDMENILGDKIPAIQTVSSIISSLESQEALKLIFLKNGKKVGAVMDPPYINYNGVYGQFDPVPVQRRPDCVGCGSKRGQENINIAVESADATIGDLFQVLQNAKHDIQLEDWMVTNTMTKSFIYNPSFERGKTQDKPLKEFEVYHLTELTFTSISSTDSEDISQYNVIVNYLDELDD